MMAAKRKLQRVEDIDFFLVGPGHSGTTSLNAILNQHPDIYLPPESNFVTWTHRTQPITAFFEGREAKLFGEHGNNYFSYEGVPQRVKAINAAAKIVVVIQDPIKRIIRNYRHDVRWGVLGRFISLEVALLENFFRERYVRPSRYLDNLDRWLEYFPAEQVFLYQSDANASVDAARSLFTFLGVDPVEPNLAVRENESVFTLLPEVHRTAMFGKGNYRRIAKLVEPLNRWLGKKLVGEPVITEADLAEASRLLGEQASLDAIREGARRRGLPGSY